MSYIKDRLSPYPYLRGGTTKRSETFTMNYSPYKISSRKSVFVMFLRRTTAFCDQIPQKCNIPVVISFTPELFSEYS
jgi:hypothetical protein